MKRRVIERVKQFHRESGEQAIIHIDSTTAQELYALTLDEAGAAVDAIERHGPTVIASIGGNPVLWDTPRFEVVALTESERNAWEEQERRLKAEGKPRLAI